MEEMIEMMEIIQKMQLIMGREDGENGEISIMSEANSEIEREFNSEIKSLGFSELKKNLKKVENPHSESIEFMIRIMEMQTLINVYKEKLENAGDSGSNMELMRVLLSNMRRNLPESQRKSVNDMLKIIDAKLLIDDFNFRRINGNRNKEIEREAAKHSGNMYNNYQNQGQNQQQFPFNGNVKNTQNGNVNSSYDNNNANSTNRHDGNLRRGNVSKNFFL